MEENLTCIAWGDLRQDKVGRLSHDDCPVIVTSSTSCAVPVTVPLPAVCGCGCHACKDAWFAEGRPISRDGKIVREADDEPNGLRHMDVVSDYPSDHVLPRFPVLWWISFADSNLPAGSQFLGVCIVHGFDLHDAIVRSHMARCNPGGSVRAAELPKETARRVPKNRIDVLLSKTEAMRLGQDLDES